MHVEMIRDRIKVIEKKWTDGEGVELFFPFTPIYDHGISMTIKNTEGKVRVSDLGDTIGELFSNGKLIKDGRTGSFKNIIGSDDVVPEQDEFIKKVLSFHEVHVGDGDELWKECDDNEKDILETVISVLQAIIQVYAVIVM